MHTPRHVAAAVLAEPTGLRIMACPEPGCCLPTEVYDEVELASTSGLVVHARTRCVAGHWFFMPMEYLDAGHTAAD